mmetsp:Transcript_91610/g.213044  ORF Transcript_91610/g.213044 Transcript_91610/m.213044 type:complete len:253 (+) Transcript_91610:741-1499(+)
MAPYEVEEHVPDGFKVVSPALFATLVGIDRSISCSACEAQPRPELCMLVLLLQPVPLAQAKVNDIQVVNLLLNTKHEVFRLDVTVNDSLGMQVLNAVEQLFRDHCRAFDIEAALATPHAIFERSAKQLHHHALVMPLLAPEETLSYALRSVWSGQHLQNHLFMLQLRSASPYIFELHSDLLLCACIVAEPDLAKTPSSEFLVDLIGSALDLCGWLIVRGGHGPNRQESVLQQTPSLRAGAPNQVGLPLQFMA